MTDKSWQAIFDEFEKEIDEAIAKLRRDLGLDK